MPIADVVTAVTKWRTDYPHYQLFQDYYDGRHQLRFASEDWRQKYASLIGAVVMGIRENLCPAVVTGFTDAISVNSWGIDGSDREAVSQGLSRLEGLINREAFRAGDAFALAWPGRDGTTKASFQRARDMVPQADDLDPDRLLWCAKIWLDTPSNRGRVNIYTDRGVERWETANPLASESRAWSEMPTELNAWRGCTDKDGDWLPHDYGVVPVCWWKQDADDQTGPGRSILSDVVPVQDALNRSLADMVVTSEAYSRPFWYLLNFQQQATQNPYALAAAKTTSTDVLAPSFTQQRWDPNKQRIFTHDGPGPFGQLDPPDLTKLQQVQDGYALKVARVVGLPNYHFSQTSGDVPSGESLRVLTTRKTSRVRAWQRDATPVWRGLMQLLGVPEPDIKWVDPAPLAEDERLSYANLARDLGLPPEIWLREAGYDADMEIDGVRLAALVRSQAASTGSALGNAFMAGITPATY